MFIIYTKIPIVASGLLILYKDFVKIVKILNSVKTLSVKIFFSLKLPIFIFIIIIFFDFMQL